MSNDENTNESVEPSNKTEATTEAASNAAGNVLAKVMELKESNPKVFFGGIGGLVVLILVMMMMGGGDGNKTLSAARAINVSVGQTYVLKGVNTYDPSATVRIVNIPGSIAAYDDTLEGAGDKCKNLPQGTKIKALNMQEITGAKYVEIEILGGECAGRKGWVISNNLN
ncbi:MAG: hypothetical protein ACKE51_02720 [Methylococcaceae bacterium]